MSQRLFAKVTTIFSRYQYQIENFLDNIKTFNWASSIQDQQLKADLQWYGNNQHLLKFGGLITRHRFEPGKDNEGLLPKVPTARTLEHSLYVAQEAQFGRLKIEYGLRWSGNHNLGPATTFEWDEQFQLQDTLQFTSGIYHSHYNWSPRLRLKWQIKPAQFLSLSYSRTVQYFHELRNTLSGFNAFFAYMPSGPNLPEQQADQISLGYHNGLLKSNWRWSIESYYKLMHNQIGFKDHAVLLQNALVESRFENRAR